MVEEANQVGWWQKFNDYTPKWFEPYLGLEEAAASRIQTYELQFVPGLLQTADYARAVITHGVAPTPRARRPRRGSRCGCGASGCCCALDAPRLWAVLDESVLRRPVGGRKVHREQLEHLLEATTLPHITVQVVPYDRSGYAADGPFTLLRFAQPELPNIGYVDHIAGGHGTWSAPTRSRGSGGRSTGSPWTPRPRSGPGS
jgi:hypothetical protein